MYNMTRYYVLDALIGSYYTFFDLWQTNVKSFNRNDLQILDIDFPILMSDNVDKRMEIDLCFSEVYRY